VNALRGKMQIRAAVQMVLVHCSKNHVLKGSRDKHIILCLLTSFIEVTDYFCTDDVWQYIM
jgi:hypothetical protein